MISPKKQMTKITQEQPEDSTYDEILHELAFARMVERGLNDVQRKRFLSNQEIKRRIEFHRRTLCT